MIYRNVIKIFLSTESSETMNSNSNQYKIVLSLVKVFKSTKYACRNQMVFVWLRILNSDELNKQQKLLLFYYEDNLCKVHAQSCARHVFYFRISSVTLCLNSFNLHIVHTISSKIIGYLILQPLSDHKTTEKALVNIFKI